jgi:hypothetical protein
MQCLYAAETERIQRIFQYAPLPEMNSAKIIPLIVILLVGLGSSHLVAQENDICFGCHEDHGLKGRSGHTVYVDPVRYQASMHGRGGIACISCHQDLAGYDNWPHPEKLEKVDCSTCHDQEFELWSQSVHGLSAREKGDFDAASCVNCHGSHYITPDSVSSSPVYPSNLPRTCLHCHGDSGLEGKHEGMGRAEKVKLYLGSVHGRALEKSGLVITATCSSCHGSHRILALKEFYPTIPKACGQCHARIYEDYLQGVHGQAYQAGSTDIPLCTDCHGEHNILRPDNPESTVSPAKVNRVCSHCHENMALSGKYGFPLGRLDSYKYSFHGVALGLGDLRVANCASCHDHHNIRPSSDPQSTVNQRNLARTCGKCHPNAGENFAEGKIHVQGKREENLGAWLVKIAYLVFISGLIGGFIIYIGLDLASWRRRKKAREKISGTKGE